MYSAEDWIDKLGLEKHPEGGYFREMYRSGEYIKKAHLPGRFSGNRCFSTSIYFLLEYNDFSVFHQINQDEIWHFYSGGPLGIHIINGDGIYSHIVLGKDISKGQVFQAVVPEGCYFGARCEEGTSYSLTGCTVAPGFEFEDLKMPEKNKLISLFPIYKEIIQQLTKNKKDE